MAVTVPSGISSVLMSLHTVPKRFRSPSWGSSTDTSVCGNAASQPLPDSTSCTSFTDFSRPTVTGNTVPGKTTALRRARMGITGGKSAVSTFMDAASPTTGIIFTSTEEGIIISCRFFI